MICSGTRKVGWLAALALLAACARPAPLRAPGSSAPALVPVAREVCEQLLRRERDPDSLRRAAARSQQYLNGRANQPSFSVLGPTITSGRLRRAIEIVLDAIDASGERRYERACEHLTLYRIDLPRPILMTGYYEPILPASRVATSRFHYPLYGRPADLVTIERAGKTVSGRLVDGRPVPYYSRGEIESGAMGSAAKILAWLDDPVERFFLHIQGSGLLALDDGTQLRVGYDGSNGRPYRSIGRVLAESGAIPPDEITMQSLKAYLRQHPTAQAQILNRNERYVFFREVPTGPIGSLGVPLTAGRSLAADPTVYPPGALVFLRLYGAPASGSHAAFIQDSGAAITGSGRLDLFVGTGETAAQVAGRLRAATEMYLPLPRQAQKRGSAPAAPPFAMGRGTFLRFSDSQEM